MRKNYFLLLSALLLVALVYPQSAYSKKIKYSKSIVYDGEIKKDGKQSIPNGQGILTASYSYPTYVQCKISGSFDNDKVENASLSITVSDGSKTLSFSTSGDILTIIMPEIDKDCITLDDIANSIIPYYPRSSDTRTYKASDIGEQIEVKELSGSISGNEPIINIKAITHKDGIYIRYLNTPGLIQTSTDERKLLWPDFNYKNGLKSNGHVIKEVSLKTTNGTQVYSLYNTSDGYCFKNDNATFYPGGTHPGSGLIKISENLYAVTTDDWRYYYLCKDVPESIINEWSDKITNRKDITESEMAPYCYYQGTLIKTSSLERLQKILNAIQSPENYDFKETLLGWSDIESSFLKHLNGDLPAINSADIVLIPYEERKDSIQIGLPKFSVIGDDIRYMKWAGGKPLLIFGQTYEDLISPLREGYERYVMETDEAARVKEEEDKAYIRQHGFEKRYEDVAKKHGEALVKQFFKEKNYVIIGFPIQCMIDIAKAHNSNLRGLQVVNAWYVPELDSQYSDADGKWDVYKSTDGQLVYLITVRNGKIVSYRTYKYDQVL